MGISKSAGLIAATVSFISFGTSGAFVKPLLEAGWSPVAAVTARALIAGLVLLPLVVVVMRWRRRRERPISLHGVGMSLATS